MEALYSNFFDYILHFDRYLPLVMEQYGHWIYAILFTIVFCETGLVVTPFLPGDSLLFACGALAATAGGPGRASETVAMLIYNNLFTYYRAGYGQAIAVVFTAAIFVVSTIVSKTLRAREVEI